MPLSKRQQHAGKINQKEAINAHYQYRQLT
nr:MAG TPA: hypothetical protein [Caudoviricetes sp.]